MVEAAIAAAVIRALAAALGILVRRAMAVAMITVQTTAPTGNCGNHDNEAYHSSYTNRVKVCLSTNVKVCLSTKDAIADGGLSLHK